MRSSLPLGLVSIYDELFYFITSQIFSTITMFPEHKGSEHKKNKLVCVQLITKICSLFGFCPANRNNKLYNIYVILLAIVSTLGWIHTVYIKISYLLDEFNVFIVITDQVSCSFLCLATVTFSLTSTFVNHGKFLKVIESLKRFDYAVNIPSPYTIKMLITLLIIGNVTILFPILLDTLSWISLYNVNRYKYYFIRNFQYYQLGIILMLWMWLVVETRKRFVLLNQFLIKLISIPERLQVNNIKATNKCEVRNEIKRITALYNELCDVVDLINDVFGAGLLISVIFTISYVLLYSIILIDFTVFKIGSSSDVWIIYTSIVWLIENFVKIMALALAGENLSSEANKTVNVCYGLINKLENSEEIRQKLIFLIQQALDRKPCLKASGFFVVKSTMTGFIVGSITSYVIVAVQFLNEMQTHVTQ